MKIRNRIEYKLDESDRCGIGSSSTKTTHNYGEIRNNVVVIEIHKSNGFTSYGGSYVMSEDSSLRQVYFIWQRNDKAYFQVVREEDFEDRSSPQHNIELMLHRMARAGKTWTKPLEIELEWARRCYDIIKECLEMESQPEAESYFRDRLQYLTGDILFPKLQWDKNHKYKTWKQQVFDLEFFPLGKEKEVLADLRSSQKERTEQNWKKKKDFPLQSK